MKRLIFPLALPCLLSATVLMADDFTGFSMEFVEIGNPGNADDGTVYGGAGRVDYTYRMAKNEVSRGMIEAYNTHSGGPVLTLFDLGFFGGNGVNRPATGISWNEAARFVNWLNTSKGHNPAYKFISDGANDNIALWTGADTGYDPSNLFRNSQAHYFLPSDDEWYKAAYYDPTANGGLGGYWNFATGSDDFPAAVASGTDPGTAVYDKMFTLGPADVESAGGLSPYGTMAQSGNALEILESSLLGNTDPNGGRIRRGGVWATTNPNTLSSSSFAANVSPSDQLDVGLGFRVASVPEPSGTVLILIGCVGATLRRCR